MNRTLLVIGLESLVVRRFEDVDAVEGRVESGNEKSLLAFTELAFAEQFVEGCPKAVS